MAAIGLEGDVVELPWMQHHSCIVLLLGGTEIYHKYVGGYMNNGGQPQNTPIMYGAFYMYRDKVKNMKSNA